jgi:hypothetical protein
MVTREVTLSDVLAGRLPAAEFPESVSAAWLFDAAGEVFWMSPAAELAGVGVRAGMASGELADVLPASCARQLLEMQPGAPASRVGWSPMVLCEGDAGRVLLRWVDLRSDPEVRAVALTASVVPQHLVGGTPV